MVLGEIDDYGEEKPNLRLALDVSPRSTNRPHGVPIDALVHLEADRVPYRSNGQRAGELSVSRLAGARWNVETSSHRKCTARYLGRRAWRASATMWGNPRVLPISPRDLTVS